MSFILQKKTSQQKDKKSLSTQQEMASLFKYKYGKVLCAKPTTQIQWRYIFFRGLYVFSSTICMVSAFARKQVESNQSTHLIDKVCLFFGFSSIIFSVYAEVNYFIFDQMTSTYKKTSNLIKTRNYIFLILFNLILPNGFFEGIQIKINTNYQLNSLLCAIVYLRIISIINFLVQTSRFYGSRVGRVLDIYGGRDKLSLTYGIKCLFKQNILITPLFLLIISLLFIPFVVITLNQAAYEETDFVTTLYDTVISMLTVGYGDINHSGEDASRVWVLLAVIIGSFITSFLTLSVIDFFKLTDQQQKAFNILKRLQFTKIIQDQQKLFVKALVSDKKVLKSKNMKEIKEYMSPNLINRRSLLKQVELKQKLGDCYFQNCLKIDQGIRKIAEKQVLINNLMNFYFTRKIKAQDELRQQMQQVRIRNKSRADQSKKIAEIYKNLISQ